MLRDLSLLLLILRLVLICTLSDSTYLLKIFLAAVLSDSFVLELRLLSARNFLFTNK